MIDAVTIQRSPLRTSPPLAARIWHALAHPAVLLLLLLLLLPVFIALVWLPQAPTPMGEEARNAWLATTAAQYPAGEWMQALGLFDLAHNGFLKLLMTLLAVVLAVRLVNRLQLAWLTRHLSAPLNSLPCTNAYDIEMGRAFQPEQWGDFCDNQFQRQRREIDENTGLTRQWRGDRHQRWTWVATLLEVGLVLLLLSLALNLRFGWQLDDLLLDPGGFVALEPYSSQTLELSEDGDTLVLCCQPERTISVSGAIMSAGGLQIRQQQVGPALTVVVHTGDNLLLLHPIEQGGSPEQELVLRFPQERSERAVAIPERNLFLRVVHTGPDQYNIEVLDASSAVLLSQKIEGTSSLILDDMELQFTPTRHLKLGVISRPWLWLLIPSIVFILAGLFVRWRFPYLRVGAFVGSASASIRWQGQQGVHPAPEEIDAQLAKS